MYLTHLPARPVWSRRRLLRGALAVGAPWIGSASWSAAGPSKTRALKVVQLLDPSAEQRELSRDYAAGWRLAWTDQPGGGVRLETLEVMPQAVDSLLGHLGRDPSVLGLVGVAGERLTRDCLDWCRSEQASVPMLAPWMLDPGRDHDPNLLPIFPSRDAQIRYAVHALSSVGHRALGLVYPSQAAWRDHHAALAGLAASMGLEATAYVPAPGEDMAALAARLPAHAPAMLLFLGETLGMVALVEGLYRRSMTRYVIGLADINLTVLQELGVARMGSRIILTQVVPDPLHGALPVLRRYRASLARLFDEPPAPMTLAGYLAGTYVGQLLADTGPASRVALSTALKVRRNADLGGFELDYARSLRGSTRVWQTLLTSSGRLLR